MLSQKLVVQHSFEITTKYIFLNLLDIISYLVNILYLFYFKQYYVQKQIFWYGFYDKLFKLLYDTKWFCITN